MKTSKLPLMVLIGVLGIATPCMAQPDWENVITGLMLVPGQCMPGESIENFNIINQFTVNSDDKTYYCVEVSYELHFLETQYYVEKDGKTYGPFDRNDVIAIRPGINATVVGPDTSNLSQNLSLNPDTIDLRGGRRFQKDIRRITKMTDERYWAIQRGNKWYGGHGWPREAL